MYMFHSPFVYVHVSLNICVCTCFTQHLCMYMFHSTFVYVHVSLNICVCTCFTQHLCMCMFHSTFVKHIKSIKRRVLCSTKLMSIIIYVLASPGANLSVAWCAVISDSNSSEQSERRHRRDRSSQFGQVLLDTACRRGIWIFSTLCSLRLILFPAEIAWSFSLTLQCVFAFHDFVSWAFQKIHISWDWFHTEMTKWTTEWIQFSNSSYHY